MLIHVGGRTLFLVGCLPAYLTILIRRKVAEPEVWTKRTESGNWRDLFRPPLLRRTVIGTSLATSTLFAYWGLFTWLPGFLSLPKSGGGAGWQVLQCGGWRLPR